MWWQRSVLATNKVGQHLAGRQADSRRHTGQRSTFHFSWNNTAAACRPSLGSSHLRDPAARNHDPLQVGRWPAVALRPHQICHASTHSVLCRGREEKIKFFLALWSGITFHFRCKVGALVSRGVISLPHIFPKSAASVRQAKVWKWWQRRRAGVRRSGISVAESYRDWKGRGLTATVSSSPPDSPPTTGCDHLLGWHIGQMYALHELWCH